MPKTPPRKRSGQLVASPENTISAASKNCTGEKNKKKKYQFAPIDNLEDKTRSDTSVLKSISVSQVRNSGNYLAHGVKIKNKSELRTPPKKKDITTAEYKTKRETGDNTRFSKQGEEEPSEEVIWEYCPIEKDVSDQPYSSHANSEDLIEQDACQDPSSTPMIPKRLKSVLNFASISEREQSERESTLSVQLRETTRLKDFSVSLKESVRDIDDILGDIEGEVSRKHHLTSLNQLPSSPSRIPSEVPVSVVNGGTETPDIEFTNDDDESLIEILTQKFTQRKTSRSPKMDCSDTLDDSLIEQIDSLEEKQKISRVEEEIEDVEVRISQALNMKAQLSEDSIKATKITQKTEISEYIERAKSAIVRDNVKRFVVLSVNDLNLPKVGRQKVMSCIDRNGDTTSIIVRHPWVFLEIEKGDVIHIIEGKNIENKRLLSDDKNPITQLRNDNLLILNPDVLLSATSVGSSIECLRRAILQLTLEDPRGEPSLPMIVGNIVHELLQDSLVHKLLHKKLDMEYLEKTLASLMEAYSFQLLQCNEDLASVTENIRSTHLKNIHQFINKFVQKNNYGCYVSVSGTRITDPLSISGVLDIEENIWSPIYGLKGFLDATVEAHVENSYALVPLEVKTGKHRSLSHETQGLLYTLLLHDRYEVSPDFFLLLYTGSNDLIKFPSALRSIQHVLMFRNQMATSLKYALREITTKERYNRRLPPIMQSSICDTCSVKHTCMVLNKLLEDGHADESGLKQGEYEGLTNHLLLDFNENKAFLGKYIDLLIKEESSISGISQELFLLDSKTRESLSGHCISNLSVSNSSRNPTHKHLFLHKFVRKSQNGSFNSMLHSQFSLNDMVIISDEEGHFSLCQGRITALSSNSVTVSTRRKVLNNRSKTSTGKAPTVHSVVNENADQDLMMRTQNLVSYRIDRNDVHSSLKLARFNLLNLFLPPVNQFSKDMSSGKENVKRSAGGDERMRSILVNNRVPRFTEEPTFPFHIEDKKAFNDDQRRAIEKVMRVEDYALILGMPGTGKTTVIAEIIRILAGAGKSILLASYTNSAVDNILLKLIPTNFSIVRLGVQHRIHPKVLPYQPNYESVTTYDEFLEQVNGVSVVATTCLGIKDYMFTVREKDFDYVILDEASQISMPIALGPIRFGEKFIMVGDHNQLPPLVKNDAARAGGLEESLFKMICDRQPDSICELTHQYRMCEDIVSLSNFLIYDGKLKCGNSIVSNQCLKIPNPDKLDAYKTLYAIDSWLKHVLDPKNNVIFLNYDNDKSICEDRQRDNITNEGEIIIAKQCLDALTVCGVDPSNIGVMTLYRAQLNLIRKSIDTERYNGLEILTADQFQGRDTECIIISLVRSNDQNSAGSLLRELRRVNVALTRAKSKLIIIGSKKTIASTPEMSDLVNYIHEKNWMYELPSDFLNAYNFRIEEGSIPNREHTAANEKDIVRSNICSKKAGAKNITATSKMLRGKPIVRQTLSEFK